MGDGTKPLGVVLAGGAAGRLGGSKAGLELAGKPLISYPLAALAAAGIEAVVVAKPDTALPPLNVPVLREPAEPRHPLLGIVTAMESYPDRPVVACPCDVPIAPPALFQALAASPFAAVVSGAGRIHPLLARFPPPTVRALREALAREHSALATTLALEPAFVERPADELVNVNTRADLERAASLLKRLG